MSAPPALDAAALARLNELDPDGRHGVVARVLVAFDTSLTRMLAQLAAQQGQDGPGAAAVLSSVAHTLKSSSASVGALALSRACAEVEQRLRSGALTDLDAQVQRLLGEGEAALVAVRAMLRPEPPSA